MNRKPAYRPEKKKIRFLVRAAAALLLPVLLFILSVRAGVLGPVPGKQELGNIRHHEASQIYSADGRLLGTYFVQNRAGIPLEDVPDEFLDALIAIEDVRFYRHGGLDYRAMLRVLVKTLILGQDAGGGSTITQQLAKNLYPRESSGRFGLASDKVREIIIASRLERLYSKHEILELYLNTVSFGEETFGLEMASRRFFDTVPAGLQLHEAATLAGVLRATTWYNPRRFPERALHRRNVVLRQMERYGKISPGQADSVTALPLAIRYNRITENEGPAPHFREQLRMKLHRLLREQPALDGNTYNLYTDGLRIETTLDSRVQTAAEEAVKTHTKYLQSILNRRFSDRPVFGLNDPAILSAWRQSTHYRKLKSGGRHDQEIEEIFHTPVPTTVFTWEGEQERLLSPHDSIAHYLSFLNAGLLAMHPADGRVMAWVGGINHRYFRYDHVTARRQTGSAFKPVVFAAALEAGMRPCDYHRNRLSTWAAYDDWTPRNTRGEYGGYASIQAALARSVNTIAVDVLMQTGIDRVLQTADEMGITSPIPSEPSIALGTAELSLLELTAAYTTFANGGVPSAPYFLKAIYNAEGKLIYDFRDPGYTSPLDPADGEFLAISDAGPDGQAVSPETAAAMVRMLSMAVDEGTGSSLRSRFGIRHALAGKTGTTQQYTDGWFIGFTPDLVFGAWSGGANPRVRFDDSMGLASQTALPIAGHFLNNLNEKPGLGPQAMHFHTHQWEAPFRFDCPDERDDRITDRVREFISGQSADEPRRVEEKENRSLRSRVRRLFGRE